MEKRQRRRSMKASRQDFKEVVGLKNYLKKRKTAGFEIEMSKGKKL